MPRKVLVVDDSRINRQLLRRILAADYDVLEAENGREALALLREAPDDCSAVLLDLMMPEMDGYEMLRELRGDERLAGIPVIVTTGSADDEAEIRALSLGANDYILKPYNPVVIRHRLGNTIRLRETAAIANLARFDPLTGLYSRAAFYEKAAEMIAARESGYYALSCMNINSFRVINDQYGSETGDRVLRHAAAAIGEGVGAAGGIACRISADNFAALYPSAMLEGDEPEAIIERVCAPDGLPPITISIGRYIMADKTLPVSAMYDRAMLAQRTVKGRYDRHTAVYSDAMREQLLREQEIVGEMDGALAAGQFEVWLQPQYNHSTGALVGAEALARWRHPERGLIPPGEFIPVFERNGFVYELDKFVWRECCRALRRWLDAGMDPLPVSVNVSRYDIFRPDFFEVITGCVQELSLPVELLRLEITESAFAQDSDLIIDAVTRLTEFGFTVEIDDFGSGYSSLNTLKDVPARILKLDMRFLEGTRNSERGGNILESIVRMAKWLGMPVIAEGVETRQQADFLRSVGCSYIQGWLYAKPMPMAEYEALAAGAKKERRMAALETVENLDNNRFWDPASMDTLIFNSYVGGACIFEHRSGATELLRVNDKYVQELRLTSIEQALSIRPGDYMDEESLAAQRAATAEAVETGEERACDVALHGLPGVGSDVYLRVAVRLIARAGDRELLYCTVINVTVRREAERAAKAASEQLQAIMKNINGGVTAVVVGGDGAPTFLYSNDQYYDQLGYSRAQFEQEVEDPFALIYPEDRERVRQATRQASLTRMPLTISYRAVRRDGSVRWLRSSISVVEYPGVTEPVQLSVANDVTALLEAQQREQEAAARLSAIMDNMSGGVTAVVVENGVHRIVFANERYYEMLGYTRAQFEAELPGVMEAVHPDDRAQVRQQVVALLERRGTDALEYRCLRRDGSLISVRCDAAVTAIAGVGDTVMLSVLTDVSALAEANEQLRFLNDTAHDLLAETDADTGIDQVLHKLRAYFGAARSYIFEFYDDRQQTDNTYEVCAEGVSSEKANLQGVPYETVSFWLHAFERRSYVSIGDVGALGEDRAEERRVLGAQGIRSLIAVPLRRDGKLVGFLGIDDPTSQQSHVAHLSAIGDYLAVMLTRRDLVARIESDRAALSALMNDTPGGFVRMQVLPDGSIVPVYVNGGFLKLTGMSEEAFYCGYREDAMWGVHPDDRGIVEAAVREMLAAGEGRSGRYRLRFGADGWVWVMFFGRLTRGAGGAQFLNIYYTDLSETEQKALSYRESLTASLSAMMQASPDLAFIKDTEGRYVCCSRAFARLANLGDEREVVGKTDADLLGAKQAAKYAAEDRRLIEGGEPMVDRVERLPLRDGLRYASTSKYRLTDAEGNVIGIYGVGRDITETRESVERLQLLQGSLPCGLASYELTGKQVKLRYLSDGMFADTGYTREEYLAQSERDPFFFIAEEDRAMARGYIEEFLKTGRDTEFFYRCKRKDGSTRWCSMRGALSHREGDTVYVNTVKTDAEEQHAIRSRYAHELQLRRELTRDSLLSYQLNLDTGAVEDYTSRFSDLPKLQTEKKMSEEARAELLSRIAPEHRDAFRQTIFAEALRAAYARGEHRAQLDYRRQMPCGGWCWVRIGAVLMRRPGSGELIAFIDARDIDTEKKDQLALQHIVTEEIEAICLIHPKRDTVRLVKEREGYGGVGQERPYEQHIRDSAAAVLPEDRQAVLDRLLPQRLVARLEADGELNFTYRMKDKDGKLRRKSIGAFFLDDAHEEIVLSRRDVTVYFEQEERQKQVLEEANRAAEAAGRAKNEFLSRMSHDMRTPLNAILSMSGDELVACADEAQKNDYFKHIHTSGSYLLGVVNDVLEMSRVEAGRIELRPVPCAAADFWTTIETVIGELCRSKGVAFRCDNEGERFPRVLLDRVRVNQIFMNLLSNAVKFTPAGGCVSFTAETLAVQGDRITRRFTARDTGVGMSAAFLPHAFEPFAQERGGSKPLSEDGLGLGLAIAKQIVDQMGGSISIESAPGKGTAVTVELSYLRAPDDDGAAKPAADLSVLSGKRVLLCEDHPLNTRVAERLLFRQGCLVDHAVNGREGVALFSAAPLGWYDLVLMDIRMPEMDGLEASRAIRALPRADAGAVPIVALTADAFPQEREVSRKAGMDAHLAKPIEPQLLYETVAKLIAEGRPAAQ